VIDPIAQYDHDEGLAIIWGFEYEGRIPALQGLCIIGDFARTSNNEGRLFYFDKSSEIFEFDLARQEELGLSLLGFGEDSQGEVYVLANGTGTPFEETGVVLRISRERPNRFHALMREWIDRRCGPRASALQAPGRMPSQGRACCGEGCPLRRVPPARIIDPLPLPLPMQRGIGTCERR
jgi:hypothetical protein